MEAEARFRAMGSDVHVVVVGGSLSLVDAARDLVDDLEARWSRFRPASEISLMNALSGMPVRVSSPTLALVQRALEGAWITGGRYDATVLGAVLRAGYDRSFELLDPTGPPVDSSLGLGEDRIVVDVASSTVTIPSGVGFDPGGIGKGFAADLLVRELLSRGAAGACANIGGDLRVEGDAPSGDSWVVAIEHPLRSNTTQLVALRSGGVATSSRMRRAWGPTADRRHHLIDPATGRSAHSGLASATVIAAEAWQAEVLAKAAFIAGVSEGLFVLGSTGTEGLLVDDAGRAYPSAGFHRFTGSGRPAAQSARELAS
jgi:thiamine biosynthesis lipoprotein